MNLMVSPNPLLTRKQVNVHNCPQNLNNTIDNFPMEILQLNLDKFQEEIEEEGGLSKFKLKTFDPNEKVKDARLEKLKEEMGLDDTGE